MARNTKPGIRTALLDAVSARLHDGARLLVGASGGVDSQVLLHALAQAGRWELVAAHYDHGFRSDSAQDAEFVRSQAAALGVRFVMERGDGPVFCLRERLSLEEGGRILRHGFFERRMEEDRCDALVLGHHADDRLETGLMNLFRGAGARGMAGPKEWDASRRILRPMLRFRKQSVLAAAHEMGIGWREDPSNSSLAHDRNWVRRVLLPLVEERRPGASDAMLRACDNLSALSSFVEQEALKKLHGWSERQDRPRGGGEFPVEEYAALHPVLRAEILLCLWSWGHGSREGFESRRFAEVERWLASPRNGSSTWFGGDMRLVNRNGWIALDSQSFRPSPGRTPAA
jgi:tRNA(Ile)-lysidine synthase